MQERLQWIRLAPKAWCHWEPVRGGLQAHALIGQRYPQAECIVVETVPRHAAMAREALRQPWWRPTRWRAPQIRFAQPAPESVHMLWSNMALHMVADPQALFAQWLQALAVDGYLMFSCLGPDTLRELRALYAELGWPPPSHAFTDMHDWGDMLIASGFAEPVMDMERLTLTFATPERLLQELAELGRNLHPQRFAAMRGRHWHTQLHQALADRLADPRQGGQLALTFEIIYGHALKPTPRTRMTELSSVSLADMRSLLRASRRAES